MTRIPVDARKVAVVLIGIGVALGIAHFAVANRDVFGATLLDLNAERGFGTAFASLQGALCAGLAMTVAVSARQHGRSRVWWLLLALGMALYSIDEVAQVHEAVASQLRGVRTEGTNPRGGMAVIALVALPVFAVAAWGVLRVAHRRAGWLIASGLAVFWLAGFGIEEVEFRGVSGMLGWFDHMTPLEAIFVLAGIQETFEMLGVSLIAWGILRQLADDESVVFDIT